MRSSIPALEANVEDFVAGYIGPCNCTPSLRVYLDPQH